MKNVAIIGGGATGLSCALELCKNGTLDFRLFEKNSVLGGRILDVVIGDTLFPLGAHTVHSDLFDLIKELGLSNLIRPASINSSRGIFSDGRLIRVGAIPILFDRTLSLKTKIDLARLSRFLATYKSDASDSLSGLSLKEFILSRYSAGVLDNLINPYSKSELGGPAETVPATRAIRRLAGAYRGSFELDGGLSKIVMAIESRITNKVVKETAVTNVEYRPASEKAFTVSFGQNKKMDFDAVICCAPIPVLRELLGEITLPRVDYLSRMVYVVRGSNRFPKMSAIFVGDDDLNVNYLMRYGEGVVVTSRGGGVDLSPFFKSYEVIHTHEWQYATAKTAQDAVGIDLTGIPNLFIAGDYIYGGGVTASVRAGRETALRIINSDENKQQ